jgi:hypothetical protein
MRDPHITGQSARSQQLLNAEFCELRLDRWSYPDLRDRARTRLGGEWDREVGGKNAGADAQCRRRCDAAGLGLTLVERSQNGDTILSFFGERSRFVPRGFMAQPVHHRTVFDVPRRKFAHTNSVGSLSSGSDLVLVDGIARRTPHASLRALVKRRVNAGVESARVRVAELARAVRPRICRSGSARR